ncbi:MAG: ABC transporter permease, partial [Acidobacteria bacterium]|nr:ABC transporter permease [Acidobacteriota bacterium]
VIGFTSLLILGGGSVCSLVAAWRASRQDVIVALRHDTRTSTGRRHAGRWLIAAEVSISLMLLVHSGLLVRSLQSVLAVPSGMDATDVVVAYPQPHAGGYRDVDNDTYFQSLVNRLEQMPGVQRAAVANFKPAGGGIGFGERVAALNAPETDGALATFMSVSPQLFDVLRMPIIDGRDFTWNDVSQSRRVAVVSETLARQVFSDRSAIGQRVRIGMLPHRQDVEIVGVVADAHIYDLKDPNLAGIYVASLQEPNLVDGKCVVVRGTGVSLASIDAALAPLGYETVARMETLEHIVDRVLLQDRLSAMFASFFGVIALLLAAIGVYGLMSFEVQQRGRETAIRVALGASRRDVLTTTAGRAAGVTMAGLAIGALLAAGSVEALRALIFGISPYDAVTLLIAVAVLSTVAGIASLLPAWRAAKTDPASVLRTT